VYKEIKRTETLWFRRLF